MAHNKQSLVAAMTTLKLKDRPDRMADIHDRLNEFEEIISQERKMFLGYPCNAAFDYSELYKFLSYPLNNIGDPYLASNYHLNTHEFELEVLEIFEELTQADKGETWGYVTNGGTEGNHYGLFLARELHPDGIVYYSQEAHYSIGKVLRCLRLPSIMVRSQKDGTIDCEDLKENLRLNRTKPPIICANIGTTMKGAVDDIKAIQAIFEELAISKKYLHADCALSGMILPFLKESPAWNFSHGVDSLSISGHKMIGSPLPCGIVLAKQSYVNRIAENVEYIGSMDTTLTGSRNGIAPLFLWYAFKTVGLDGYRQWIERCMDTADYAINKLSELGLNPWRHPYSNTVVFDRPNLTVIQKWQLASHGPISHIITMPHVSTQQIDSLVADIKASQSVNIKASTGSHSSPAPIKTTESNAKTEEIILIGSAGVELLDDVATALGKAGISILDITSTSVDEGCLVKLRVKHPDEAIKIINQLNRNNNYGVSRLELNDGDSNVINTMDFQQASQGAVMVKIDDRPGSLAQITHRCMQAKIDLQSVRIVWRGIEAIVIEITSQHPDKLVNVLDRESILLAPSSQSS